MSWRPLAFLFDLDGVLTPTAVVHRSAWAETFNRFLQRQQLGPPFTDGDYFEHVDGKPRFEGVRQFLASRGLHLPEGPADDPPGFDTLQALGNLKNELFRTVLSRDGLEPYIGSIRLLGLLDDRNIPWAVVSSSANARDVLEAAGLADRTAVVIDGRVAATEQLAGKPDPETFLLAARLLGVEPEDCVVVEDALVGVIAGKAGGFGRVIGVAREDDAGALEAAGADRVVTDLAELIEELE